MTHVIRVSADADVWTWVLGFGLDLRDRAVFIGAGPFLLTIEW